MDDEGIEWRGRLKISDRAHILFDFHQIIDGLQETGRGGKNIGTTKKGIGPCYASKATRNGLRFGELAHFDSFAAKLRTTIEANQAMYDFEYDVDGEIDKYKLYAEKLDGMIVDGVHYVNDAYNSGKRIITEGANAAMLDLDYGTYPFVTSSATTAGGISTGMGLSPDKIECVMGVVKAYTTRVGSGPFPTELTDDLSGGDLPRGAPGTVIGKHLQDEGFEYGVTTGRKRRCGWLDIPVVQYGAMINGYGSINMTKLDVLDKLEEVKIGVAYSINGEVLKPGQMPSTLEDLAAVEVIYESMPGWNTPITEAKTFEELPAEAQAYVRRVEQLVGCPVTWIGVGPGREEMATNGFTV